jgi:hypothetical protein
MMNLPVEVVKRLDPWNGGRGSSGCRMPSLLSGQLDDGHQGRLGSWRENQARIAPVVGVG